MGNQRHHLLARVNMGGPPWEQAPVWREQNPSLRGELQDTGAGDHRRKRLSRAAQQHAGILERPAAHAGAEPADGVPRENHWIQKGEDSRLFYAEVATWLDAGSRRQTEGRR